MNAETLAALKGSIAKWRAIVAGTGDDEGSGNCPLCLLFHGAHRPEIESGRPHCSGCPVRERSGLHSCHGTPYLDYAHGESPTATKAAAEAELAFLISLLPEGEPA